MKARAQPRLLACWHSRPMDGQRRESKHKNVRGRQCIRYRKLSLVIVVRISNPRITALYSIARLQLSHPTDISAPLWVSRMQSVESLLGSRHSVGFESDTHSGSEVASRRDRYRERPDRERRRRIQSVYSLHRKRHSVGSESGTILGREREGRRDRYTERREREQSRRIHSLGPYLNAAIQCRAVSRRERVSRKCREQTSRIVHSVESLLRSSNLVGIESGTVPGRERKRSRDR
jgi:hypothetical protein